MSGSLQSTDCSLSGYSVHRNLLFQGIFLTQGSNLGILHFRQILYHLSHQESPSRAPQEAPKHAAETEWRGHTTPLRPTDLQTRGRSCCMLYPKVICQGCDGATLRIQVSGFLAWNPAFSRGCQRTWTPISHATEALWTKVEQPALASKKIPHENLFFHGWSFLSLNGNCFIIWLTMVFRCHCAIKLLYGWGRNYMKEYQSDIFPPAPPGKDLLTYFSKVCFVSKCCHRLIINYYTCNQARGTSACVSALSPTLHSRQSDPLKACDISGHWFVQKIPVASHRVRVKSKIITWPSPDLPPPHLSDLTAYASSLILLRLPLRPAFYFLNPSNVCACACVCVCVYTQALCTCCFLCWQFFPRSVHVYTDASFRSLFKHHLFSVLFCVGKDFLVWFAAELQASTTLNK